MAHDILQLSIVSPSPNPLSRIRSYTMVNFITITEYSFKFGPYLHCDNFHNALNNSLSEQFENTVVERFSTNVNHTVIAEDIVTVIRDAVITMLEAASQADHNTIAPMVNSLVLFKTLGRPAYSFPFRIPGKL